MSIRPNPAGQDKKIKWGHLQNFKTYVNNASKEEKELTPEEKRQELFAAMKPYNSEDYIGKAIFVVGGGGVYDTTPSVSPSPTPTSTLTPTPSITPTQTITPTNTETPTNTPTSSLTPTPTSSAVDITPTNTPTNTSTPTPTPTNPGITITFGEGRSFSNTSSSYTATGMTYGGAGLVVVALLTNGNVSVSSVSLGGTNMTILGTQYNCSSENRISLWRLRLTGGTSADLVITTSSNITSLDVGMYKIVNNISDIPSNTTTICQGSGTATYTLNSLLGNNVGIYATINGTPSCVDTTTDYSGNLGTFASFKQVASGTKACPVSYGGIVAGSARAWR